MNQERLTQLGAATILHLKAEGASTEEIAALIALIVINMIPKKDTLDVMSRAADILTQAQITMDIKRITDGS